MCSRIVGVIGLFSVISMSVSSSTIEVLYFVSSKSTKYLMYEEVSMIMPEDTERTFFYFKVFEH